MERESETNKTVALGNLDGFANSPHMAGEGEEGGSDGSGGGSDGSDDVGDDAGEAGVEMELFLR